MSSAELLVRDVPAEQIEVREEDGGGLTVEALVLPFNAEAEISERGISYREMFVPGSCDRAVRNPDRVMLTYGHVRSVEHRLGYGRRFAESADGLVGTFRLDRSTADKARDILTSSHRGFSIGFVSLRPEAQSERPGELVVRRSVHVDHVAATPAPAYAATVGTATIRDIDALLVGEPTRNELDADEKARQDAAMLASVDALLARQAQLDAMIRGK